MSRDARDLGLGLSQSRSAQDLGLGPSLHRSARDLRLGLTTGIQKALLDLLVTQQRDTGYRSEQEDEHACDQERNVASCQYRKKLSTNDRRNGPDHHSCASCAGCTPRDPCTESCPRRPERAFEESSLSLTHADAHLKDHR